MSGIATAVAMLAAICLSAGDRQVVQQTDRFTLAWQHSVEKTAWEEDYLVAGRWLFLVEARIRGSGAGMEPPPAAVLADGAWHYRPAQRWFDAIHLARSEFSDDHRLCIDGRCRPLADWIARGTGPVSIRPCRAGTAASAVRPSPRGDAPR